MWIDKETGALLKCSLDYEQNLPTRRAARRWLPAGNGHIELVVSKVNNTAVKLPQ